MAARVARKRGGAGQREAGGALWHESPTQLLAVAVRGSRGAHVGEPSQTPPAPPGGTSSHLEAQPRLRPAVLAPAAVRGRRPARHRHHQPVVVVRQQRASRGARVQALAQRPAGRYRAARAAQAGLRHASAGGPGSRGRVACGATGGCEVCGGSVATRSRQRARRAGRGSGSERVARTCRVCVCVQMDTRVCGVAATHRSSESTALASSSIEGSLRSSPASMLDVSCNDTAQARHTCAPCDLASHGSPRHDTPGRQEHAAAAGWPDLQREVVLGCSRQLALLLRAQNSVLREALQGGTQGHAVGVPTRAVREWHVHGG
jgi:hypothetical protein